MTSGSQLPVRGGLAALRFLTMAIASSRREGGTLTLSVVCRWLTVVGAELGLLPDPDVGGKRWSACLVGDIRGGWPEILAGIDAARELGADRCAGLAAVPCGPGGTGRRSCKGRRNSRRSSRCARRGCPPAWTGTRLPPGSAGGSGNLIQVLAARGITAGRFSRYAAADIDAPAADHDLGEQVRLGPAVTMRLQPVGCGHAPPVSRHQYRGT